MSLIVLEFISQVPINIEALIHYFNPTIMDLVSRGGSTTSTYNAVTAQLPDHMG
jgi:hypothetical protein